MTRRREEEVLLGFEVGTGQPVRIPLAHTFITGQTQLSGKTTALRAIVVRSEKSALAFVTKRGEEFEGRRIRPFLPREGDKPIHWRLVETILASALGQRSMKYERYWIVNAAKGAKSLEDVRRNVKKLMEKAKGSTRETYELIGEYLDLVLPEMRELNAVDALDLQPGLNVMDLVGVGQQLQAMVIRACLEQINLRESEVLTIFPEAWEFVPRGRVTPASEEAISMARKGAVIGNFLLVDSQDIAGVATEVRQAASVWILGVQRELNELKRTLQMIPASVKKPKPSEITSLELGQFIACWGRYSVRTYVQPAWMEASEAIAIARGAMSIDEATPAKSESGEKGKVCPELTKALSSLLNDPPYFISASQPGPPLEFEEDDDMSVEGEKQILEGLHKLGESLIGLTQELRKERSKDPSEPTEQPRQATGGSAEQPDPGLELNLEEIYQSVKERLCHEAPGLLKLMVRLALFVAEGFFDEPKIDAQIRAELGRHGLVAQKTYAHPTYSKNMAELVEWGFLMEEEAGYQANPKMKKNIKK